MTKCLISGALLTLLAALSSCATHRNNSAVSFRSGPSEYPGSASTSGTGQPVETVHTY